MTSLPLSFLSHPVNAAPLTQPFSKVIVYREKLHLITPVITNPASLSHQTTSNPQAGSFYSTKWVTFVYDIVNFRIADAY